MKPVNAIILALVSIAPLPAAGDAAGTPGLLELRGRWVHDASGKPVGPVDFRRGLQPSGLAYGRGELWCVGDQRSEFPGHLLRIDPKTSRLLGKPIRFTRQNIDSFDF